MSNAWLPAPDTSNLPYFDGAIAGKLRLQRCDDCGHWCFPVRTRCQLCGSTRLQWADASGRGVVYSHALLRREYHPRHSGHLPIIMAQVDLEEGVRVNTNLVDVAPAAVKTGMKVKVAFEHSPAGEAVVVFKPLVD
jgi:uncharacterized OB-fold protein